MTHGAKQGTGATVEETGCEKGVHTEKEQLTIEVGIITEGRITGGRLHKKNFVKINRTPILLI